MSERIMNMSERIITLDDIESWMGLPMTEEFFERVNALKTAKERSIGNGSCMNTDSAENTLALTAKAVGFCEGIKDALSVFE